MLADAEVDAPDAMTANFSAEGLVGKVTAYAGRRSIAARVARLMLRMFESGRALAQEDQPEFIKHT
jgi:hypothetical protein